MPNMLGQTTYDEAYSKMMATTAEASVVMGNAISKASGQIDDTMTDAIKYMDDAYVKAQSYLTPFRVAGQNSLQTLNNFIGVNGKQKQQEALSGIMQPAMDQMIKYGPQVAQQAMGMFFQQAGVPPEQANQALNTATANSINSTGMSGGMFDSYMGQYKRLMNTSPEDLSNSMISSLMDPVTGAVTKAAQGFTDSMIKYGQKGIEGSAAAKGMLNSGRTLAELQDMGMGVAGQYIMPAIQNVLGMGMQSGNNLVSGILSQGGNMINQATGMANSYMGNMFSGASGLAGQSLSTTQNALSNVLSNATGAATAAASGAGQQGTTGAGLKYEGGKYKADNTILAGKVQSDALNAIAQQQFMADMGPYVNSMGGVGGGGGGPAPTASPTRSPSNILTQAAPTNVWSQFGLPQPGSGYTNGAPNQFTGPGSTTYTPAGY